MRKKRESDEEAVETGDLLAPYEATRVPSGTGPTGLPPASPGRTSSAEPVVPTSTADDAPANADPIIDLREADSTPSGAGAVDRRFEPRYSLAIPAAVTHERGGQPIVGYTVNVSLHGLLLKMPEAPPDTHVDVVVGEELVCATVWAHVVGHRAARRGDHYWHIRVVTADDAWNPLVTSA